MDTRVLYISAVVIATVSGGYYYYSGKGEKLDADAAHSMTYTADSIQMLQTDEQGHLYMRAHVDHLEQNLQTRSSNLTNLQASIYHNDRVSSTFFAQEAKSLNDNEKVILKGAVKATKIGPNGQLVFSTDELTGYPPLGKLETKHQVAVDTPDAQFLSQGLKADLNQGQYEFFNIRGKYAPR